MPIYMSCIFYYSCLLCLSSPYKLIEMPLEIKEKYDMDSTSTCFHCPKLTYAKKRERKIERNKSICLPLCLQEVEQDDFLPDDFAPEVVATIE
eukprot:c28181_g2_i1 orf=558-836(+)